MFWPIYKFYHVLTSDFERAKLNFVCVYVFLTFRSSFSKVLLGLDRRPAAAQNHPNWSYTSEHSYNSWRGWNFNPMICVCVQYRQLSNKNTDLICSIRKITNQTCGWCLMVCLHATFGIFKSVFLLDLYNLWLSYAFRNK